MTTLLIRRKRTNGHAGRATIARLKGDLTRFASDPLGRKRRARASRWSRLRFWDRG
jgi:hypothetical protein